MEVFKSCKPLFCQLYKWVVVRSNYRTINCSSHQQGPVFSLRIRGDGKNLKPFQPIASLFPFLCSGSVQDTLTNVLFSFLQTYSSLQEVLVSFGRRVLCYPLYRHFSLVSLAIHDTAKILHSGETRLPDLHRQHAHICTKAHKDHYYLCRLVVTLWHLPHDLQCSLWVLWFWVKTRS